MKVTALSVGFLTLAASTLSAAEDSHRIIKKHVVARRDILDHRSPLVGGHSVDTGLDKRTFGLHLGDKCFSLFGIINLGNCGSSGVVNIDFGKYKSSCSKYGYKFEYKKVGHGYSFQWNNQWVLDVEWAHFGKFWLPKSCDKWGFEAPEPFKPIKGCTKIHYDGYKKACGKKRQQMRYYFDANKNGYWWFWNGQFVFQSDWQVFGEFLLPKSVDKWGFESPINFTPTKTCKKEFYTSYKSICASKGGKVRYYFDHAKGSYWFYWGGVFIYESDWQFFGNFWLPKAIGKWGFETVEAFKATKTCTLDFLNGYKSVCSKRKLDSHFYFDSVKKGYWFAWNGKFIFESEWKRYGKHWLPTSVAQWGFEWIDDFKAVGTCSVAVHSGYKKACAGKGVQAHFYFDEGKQAYYFFWNNNWIVSSEWVRHGDLLLPSAVDKWGCESPQKFKPTTKCPQKFYDGYKKACAKKNVQPRYYWDAAKNGYYFWFDGCFKFETEWQMKGEYCVPKHLAASW